MSLTLELTETEQRTGGELGLQLERTEMYTSWNLALDDGVTVLPQNFTRMEDWDSWVSHFESISAIHGWSNNEKLMWMRVKLVDKAAVAFRQLSHVTKASYELTKAALRNRFEHPSKKELHKREFVGQLKSDTESWADYGDDIRLLVQRAYPDFQANAQEHLTLRHYLDQLKSPLIAVGVKQTHPTNVAEAVGITMQLESYLPKQLPTRQQTEVPLLLTTIQSSQVNILEQIQYLTSQVERLEYFAKESHTEHLPPQCVNANEQCPRHICIKCNQGVDSVIESQANTKTICETGSRSSDVATITINSVSSYFLPVCVAGMEISCLVDTGAGVSLLSGDVLDKVGQRSIIVEPVIHQKLVGVDGIPLKVRGASTFPLTIAGLEFQHRLIIADNITADAMLGLDFLDSHNCVLDLGQRKLCVNNKTCIPLVPRLSPKDSLLGKVVLQDTTVIPPVSELEVMGRIECSEKQEINGITWMVEGVQSPVFVARAVVTPQTKLVPVRLINTDLIPETLYRGTKLANAETVEERNVNVVGNVDATTSSNTSVPVYTDNINQLPDDVSQTQQDKLLALLSLYSDVIASGPNDLGHTQVLSHHIDTGDAPPIRQATRRVPVPSREKVEQLLEDMLSKKIISPSKSPWASPVVLVQKKDGSIRFCIDYRKVNAVTRKDAYPLPRVDDTFDTLAGSSWFSTLDLKSGYWQVEVNPSDREKTAF